jgi:hypothetical protein
MRVRPHLCPTSRIAAIVLSLPLETKISFCYQPQFTKSNYSALLDITVEAGFDIIQFMRRMGSFGVLLERPSGKRSLGDPSDLAGPGNRINRSSLLAKHVYSMVL